MAARTQGSKPGDRSALTGSTIDSTCCNGSLGAAVALLLDVVGVDQNILKSR